MSKIDVTLSVLIDNAAVDYQNATNQIIENLGISISDAELALEKELMRLKGEKVKLYATAMYDDFLSRKEDLNKNGDSDN